MSVNQASSWLLDRVLDISLWEKRLEHDTELTAQLALG